MCLQSWQPDDLQRSMDSGAPSDVVTAESLGNQADHLEQAVTAFKRARHLFTAALKGEHAFTAALRYQELESEVNLGCCPRALRQSLQEIKDLGEDLVQQAREQDETLARSKKFGGIESKATGHTPQVCGDCQQGNFHECSSDLPEEDVWLLPGRPGIDFRHGNQDQHTVLKMNDQDGAPNQPPDINESEVGYRRALGEFAPAKPAVETSVGTSVDFYAPLLGIKDIDPDFWLKASVDSDAPLVGIKNIDPDFVKDSGADADLEVGYRQAKDEY